MTPQLERVERRHLTRAWVAVALFAVGCVSWVGMSSARGEIAWVSRGAALLVAGLSFLAAGVLGLADTARTAELLRRRSRLLWIGPGLGAFGRALRGDRVTAVHRVLAVNLGCVVVSFGLVVSIGTLIGMWRRG